jgi:hypothetical protein
VPFEFNQPPLNQPPLHAAQLVRGIGGFHARGNGDAGDDENEQASPKSIAVSVS